MIDRSGENDLILSADELREEVIDKSILDKQAKGWNAIRTRLKMANKSGMHTITLYRRYIEKAYCLDILTLYNIFQDKKYKVIASRDGFGIIDSIEISQLKEILK